MNVLIFGASGMIGQGVVRQCLLDERVKSVVSVVRAASGMQHPKLSEVQHSDFTDFRAQKNIFKIADACFFCLGISSAGMAEEEYKKVTLHMTLAAGKAYANAKPEAVFVYISAEGADSTETGRTMWARVRGRTENELLKLPLKTSMFRLALVQPLHGATSKTKSARLFYKFTRPILPILMRMFPHLATTTENVGKAMLTLAFSKRSVAVVGSDVVNELSRVLP